MNSKSLKGRYAFIITVLLIAAAVFITRLVHWQIIQSDYYDRISMTSTSYTVTTDALRGEIYDVNGVDLAVNVTSYRVVISKLYMPDEKLNDSIVRLIEIMNQCDEKWIDELPITIDKNGSYQFNTKKQDEIDELKNKDNLNMNPYSTADECMAKLVEKYECKDYDKKQQRNIISVRYNMQKMQYSNSNPYIFADGINEKTMAVIAENMQDAAGIDVESAAVRTYTNGTVAPHMVGVTGLISAEEYNELQDKGYGYTDRIGKSGIESAFESYLRGSSGSKTYDVHSDGTVDMIDAKAAEPGDCVYLTIDARYQKIAQQALKEAIEEANTNAKELGDEKMGADCTGAAVVVLNVQDFSVLCAASYPVYDLSKYYDDYTKLSTDKTLPLFDRAFNGALAPGSTFKPMVASAALEEHAITADTQFDCEGVYTTGGLKLWCMSYHNHINMYEAIEKSCNVYFAETGRLLGIDNIDRYAKRCGLGVKTGVEINESSGTLAGPEYSKEMGSEWYSSFDSTAAIGQSDNQFTPLQLATYAATLANNGKRLKTHVVDKITTYSGDEVIYQYQPIEVDDMGVSLDNLKEVQKAMNMATNSYEALAGFDIQIAGKTGTAENNGSDHANFICYAPYDHPKIAIAVMVEHGAKSSVAINVAKKMMNAYFHGKGLTDIPKTNKDGTVGDISKNKTEENSKENSKESLEISASEN